VEDLIEKIKASIILSAEGEAYLRSIAQEKTVSKGEVLISQGQFVDKEYLIIEGCLRSFTATFSRVRVLSEGIIAAAHCESTSAYSQSVATDRSGEIRPIPRRLSRHRAVLSKLSHRLLSGHYTRELEPYPSRTGELSLFLP